MRKTFKNIAAALAAVMTLSAVSVTAFADEPAASEVQESAYLSGGWSVNDGELAMSRNPEAKAAFKKATAGLTGVNYKPVAVLGSQVVAGMNYAILCRSTVVYPGARPEWKIMYIYVDLNGNASIIGISPVYLGYTGDETDDENTENDVMTGVANPWTAYETVEEAAKAAGVDIKAPEKLGKHSISYIQSMKGLVDIRYTKGDNVITVRKGNGTDDISGDYTEYKSVTEKEINGNTVTLKGNGKGVKAAVWTDGKNSFAVLSKTALTEKFMENIIGSVS